MRSLTVEGVRSNVGALAAASRRLLIAWLLHAFWFAAMLAAAWLHREGTGLKIALLRALVTVPPVLVHATRVHRLCRAIDPRRAPSDRRRCW